MVHGEWHGVDGTNIVQLRAIADRATLIVKPTSERSARSCLPLRETAGALIRRRLSLSLHDLRASLVKLRQLGFQHHRDIQLHLLDFC